MLQLLSTKYAFRFFFLCVALICVWCTYYAGAAFVYSVMALGAVALLVMLARRFNLISGRVEYEFDLPEDRKGGKLKR